MNADGRIRTAKRLRKSKGTLDIKGHQPFWYVAKAVFKNAERHTYGEVFGKLADLIDPTCEIVDENWMVNKTTGERHGGCSLSCGHIVMNDVPAYCPFCGARVVER